MKSLNLGFALLLTISANSGRCQSVTFTFEDAPVGDSGGLVYGTQENTPTLGALMKNGFVFDVRMDGPPHPGVHFHVIDSRAQPKVPDRPDAQKGVLWRDGNAGQDPIVIASASPFSLKSLVVGATSADGSGTFAIRLSGYQGTKPIGTVVLDTTLNEYRGYADDQLKPLNGLSMDRLEIVGLSTTAVSEYMLDDLVFTRGCQVKPTDVNLSIGNGISMRASFTPSSGTLDFIASSCGFQGFNWLQTVESLPDPSPFYRANGMRLTSASTPFIDPPIGGYNYPESQQPPFAGAHPFFYNPVSIPFSCAEDAQNGTCHIYIKPTVGNTIYFSDTPKDPCLFGGNLNFTPTCDFGHALSPAAIHFKTALVGIVTASEPSPALYQWTWKSDFNGHGLGGVFDVSTASSRPADPQSGTGGVTITSVNGVPQTPPNITCAATPNTLWPPNGKSVPVKVSGSITPGTSPLVLGGTAYAVIDEYGQLQPRGGFVIGVGGNYSFGVSLIAARNGNDKDGRTYTIVVGGKDTIGNLGSCSTLVTVPHDQGH